MVVTTGEDEATFEEEEIAMEDRRICHIELEELVMVAVDQEEVVVEDSEAQMQMRAFCEYFYLPTLTPQTK